MLRAGDSNRPAWSGGLLLGDAVEGAALLDEIEAIDGDDLAAWEKLADEPEGAVIIAGLPEGGDEDGVVNDEKIDV